MDAINPNRKPKRLKNAQRVSDTTLRRRLKAAEKKNADLQMDKEQLQDALRIANEQIELLCTPQGCDPNNPGPAPDSEGVKIHIDGPYSIHDLFSEEPESARIARLESQLAIVKGERDDAQAALYLAIKTIGAIAKCITDPEKEGD